MPIAEACDELVTEAAEELALMLKPEANRLKRCVGSVFQITYTCIA